MASSSLKLRDPLNSQARMFMVGANPRQSTTITQSTDRLPMCTQLLSTYVRQLEPTFNFTCVSLRSNCLREPHCLGSSLVHLLTRHAWGGGIFGSPVRRGLSSVRFRVNRFRDVSRTFRKLSFSQPEARYMRLNPGITPRKKDSS